MFPSFNLARLPRIEFGPGTRLRVAALAARYGRRTLLITGQSSFETSPAAQQMMGSLEQAGITIIHKRVSGEPSPEWVDHVVAELQGEHINCVIGAGGGSALDAAKAIAGLLIPANSVMDHLEGVGPELPYVGPATPLIAIPTTAGTGSEATKNAVLSRHGPQGFKKSFRDDSLVAEHALIDPDLLATCPAHIIAANGMDALTQLLESYVSLRANPMMDALALSGLAHVRDHLLPWHDGEGDVAGHRSAMAYAALLSGITLAQVGLGSVHGIAAPLGAFFPIPHGVACGTTVAVATRENIAAMIERAPHHPALGKYAQVGRLFSQQDGLSETEAHTALVEVLERWTRHMDLPRLSDFGMTQADIAQLVANSRGSSMKTNPIELTDEEISHIIEARL